MKFFETFMRKNPSRNDYSIGIGKAQDVDESRFVKNKCAVVVCYKDDFYNLQNELETLKNTIEERDNTIKSLENGMKDIGETHSKNITKMTKEYYETLDSLKDNLSAKDNELKQMELKFKDELTALTEDHLKEINALEKSHSDEVLDLNKEISELKQSHQADKFENESSIMAAKQKTIDDLKDKLSECLIRHEQEVHDLETNYKDTLYKLRMKDNHDLSNQKKRLSSLKNDFEKLGFFDKHSKKYGLLLDEFDESLNEFERINKNMVSNIDKDFPKTLISEVNEDSERSD